jgi:hypothetical protein
MKSSLYLEISQKLIELLIITTWRLINIQIISAKEI